MPRVKFVADFDWKPTPAVTIAFKAGWTGLVTTPCAELAVAKGRAERTAFRGPSKPIGDIQNADQQPDPGQA